MDSEIALFWLNSKRKLKQFVQNKVDAINSKFPSSFSGHTSTTDNPADLASRGCSTVSLTTSALWQHGPKWLCDPPSWPPWPKPSTSSTVVLSAVTDQHVYAQEFSIGHFIDVNRFNSYSRLLATSVYVYSFCHRTGTTGPPTTSEIEAIERTWFKFEQLRCSPQVVSYLSSHDSHDRKIAPPICHHRMHQVGVGGTIVAIRNRFWVPSARSATRRLLTKCVTCKKVTGRHVQLPTPSELPLFRYDTSLRPFSNIGIDFTGNLTVKGRSGDHIKVYLCLFTCLTTRAINLEIVEDLIAYANHLLFGFNVTSLPHPPLDSVDYDPNFGDSTACIRTANGHTTRSVIKLYPLELNVGTPHKEPNVSEGHAEHSTVTTRPKRTAAAAARDKVLAQLIDQSHD
eukprot:gene16463-biopygen12133